MGSCDIDSLRVSSIYCVLMICGLKIIAKINHADMLLTKRMYKIVNESS